MTTTLILPGATSQSVYIKAIDNTTGLAATTLTSATAGLSISYQNTQTGTVTAITLSDLAATNSAWSSGGMKHIAGGVYRLCIPDAAVPATEGARTTIAGTATAFQILGGALVGKPVEVVSGSLVAASVTGAVGSVTGAVGSVTGHTPQTGDSFARIGALGAGLTAVGDTAGTTTLLSRVTALLQTKAEADTAHGLLATAVALSSVASDATAIKTKTDNLPSDPADQSQVEAAIAAGDDATLAAIAARPSVADFWAGITATAARIIADHVLRRSWASAAASANGDTKEFRSLLGAVAKLVNRVGIDGATLTVYEDDDTTTLGEQALTSDADAEPVTGANTV